MSDERVTLERELRKARDRVFRARANVAEAEAFRDNLIRRGKALGLSQPELGVLAGVSAVRVKQVTSAAAGKRKKAMG